jgi:hypothetical protein
VDENRTPVGGADADSREARDDDRAGAAVVPDLAVLDKLADRPPHEHAPVYEQVHAQLQSALSEIDDA